MTELKIRIVIGAAVAAATLDDNPTSRDFLALVPLELNLEDHADTEKIAYLPRKLSVTGAPAGSTPEVGDIAYYAPWGNLALFHKPFAYSAGLVKLGRIDTGLDLLRLPGELSVRIERAEDGEVT
jgi:hypothetical protein